MGDNELEGILVQTTMAEGLTHYLTRSLSSVIQDWIIDCITEDDRIDTTQYPHFGHNTSWLMAVAAIAVLNAVYDAENCLVMDGMLDAKAARLPERVS